MGVNERKSVDHLMVKRQSHSISSKSSYSANIGENFIIPDHLGRNQLIEAAYDYEMNDLQAAQQDMLEINQDWRETIEGLRESEKYIYQPLTQRILTGIKRIILEYGTNRLIFYSLYDR